MPWFLHWRYTALRHQCWQERSTWGASALANSTSEKRACRGLALLTISIYSQVDLQTGRSTSPGSLSPQPRMLGSTPLSQAHSLRRAVRPSSLWRSHSLRRSCSLWRSQENSITRACRTRPPSSYTPRGVERTPRRESSTPRSRSSAARRPRPAGGAAATCPASPAAGRRRTP